MAGQKNLMKRKDATRDGPLMRPLLWMKLLTSHIELQMNVNILISSCCPLFWPLPPPAFHSYLQRQLRDVVDYLIRKFGNSFQLNNN